MKINANKIGLNVITVKSIRSYTNLRFALNILRRIYFIDCDLIELITENDQP